MEFRDFGGLKSSKYYKFSLKSNSKFSFKKTKKEDVMSADEAEKLGYRVSRVHDKSRYWVDDYMIVEEGDKRFVYPPKSGIIMISKTRDMVLMVCQIDHRGNETGWSFPKGHRNPHEKRVDCAIREFQEETGFSSTINLHNSYIRMNNTIYYICFEETDLLTEPRGEIDTKELSKCQWIPVDEILNKRVSLNKESHFTFKILLSKKILVYSKELEKTTIETIDMGTLDGGTLDGGTDDSSMMDIMS